MSDIRKWFMKQPHKNNGAEAETPKQDLGLEGTTTGRVKASKYFSSSTPDKNVKTKLDESEQDLGLEGPTTGRVKVSKYFSSSTPDKNVKTKLDESEKPSSGKRKKQGLDGNEGKASEVKGPSPKKLHKDVRGPSPKKLQKDNIKEDQELRSKTKAIKSSKKKESKQGIESDASKTFQTPDKKVPSISEEGSKESALVGSGASMRAALENLNESHSQPGGRGGGGGSGGGGGRGRGGGRGSYGNFGDRGPPPHKGQKEVPEGAEDCLAGLTFVISGTLDSLEREEAEDLIKRHGGRITSAVSKKTSYLLADEDIGGRKSEKAKELGIIFLSEDALFDMIRKSKPTKLSVKEGALKKPQKDAYVSQPVPPDGDNIWKVKDKANEVQIHKASVAKTSVKDMELKASHSKRTLNSNLGDTKMWTEKYRPKTPNDIIGNQSIVKQLHDWLVHWDEQHLHTREKGGKGNKRGGGGASGNTSKKAVLISGPPGIGKSTSAKLISQMLGLETIEVNASDNRGKADSKIVKGIGGSTSNSIKEMVSNAALSISNMDGPKHRKKSVLIMDEVDGMSGGDRGGVADLIDSIKISKIPIICICNDRYSQKLKSLVNYCIPLNFRKPTKQQMAKRLQEVAKMEGIQINEAALLELCERVNGDMRMALNQLQYMSISSSIFKYADIQARLLGSAKDEDVTPFTAADKLLGYEGGRLRMDERIDLSMSDPDLVPLIIQENYLNYRPSAASRDVDGTLRMDLVARAAESIADGDVINVQIRRYRQWQLSQIGAFASSIIPAAFMHGSREVFSQGERNFNRFGGWLGKNSTWGKNVRLLEDVHVHFLASRICEPTREDLRLDIFPLLMLRLTNPLRKLPKEDAVQNVVEFMDEYSLSQEDFDTIIDVSKLQGNPDPLEGVQPAVKSALTKAYKQHEHSRRVRSADLLPPVALPGQKKAPKKRVASILTAVEDEYPAEEEDAVAEDEEGSDEEDDLGASAFRDEGLHWGLDNSKLKGVEIELDLKNKGKSNTKTTKANESKTSMGRAKAATGTIGVKRKR